MAEKTSVPEPNSEINKLVYVIRDDGSYGGWRTELLVKEMIEKREGRFLLCNYCRGVLRDACLFEKDGKHGVGCSLCIPKNVNKKKAQFNRETVKDKLVHCPLKNKGCDWINELSELLHHLEECELFPVVCPLGCRDGREEVSRVERRGVETHRTCCPMRTIKCEYCSVSVKACDMNGHLEVCEEFPIPCPNKCNEEFRVKRRDKSIHLSQECPLQETECPYSQFGCEAKVQRRNLEEHEKEEIHKHMKLTVNNMQSEVITVRKENEELKGCEFRSQNRMVELEVKNEELRTKIVNLEKKNEEFRSLLILMISSLGVKGSLEWKISGVKNKISQKGCTYSEPFYVGLYKFQGYVKWNGEEDTIGLLLFIMKGESDNALRWPIKYKSSILLINQLNRDKHCHGEFEVTDKAIEEEPKCFEKPKLFRNERGYGYSKFISQADTLKEKYCKDDSIELNISVELINLESWL